MILKIKSLFKKYNKKDESFDNLPLKDSREYFDELNQFIKSFDVNNLKIDSEYVWPYLRNRLWIQLYGIGNGNTKRRDLNATAIHRGSADDLAYKHRKNMKKLYGAKEVEELIKDDCKIDFLFVTVINAAEQVELSDGKIYHRITDPFYEIAQKYGKAEKVEFLRVKTSAVKKSINYYHKVLYILSPSIYKYGYIRKMKFSNLLSILKKKIPSVVHSGEKLRASIDWEFHTRDFYIDVLKKLDPKVVFLNGFHFQTPLISAAHHLNIKTVDLQHGIQVGWNPLYNDWKEMPEEGYQGLPDYFFVWGQKEYDSIKKVFKGKKHMPVLSGFPWMERQLDLTNQLGNDYLNMLNKSKVRILLALQKQPEIPNIYKELIENSPKEFLWIVRHHPKGKRFTVSDFTESGKSNVIIDSYFDNITLAHLFKHIEIVISEGSTVAAEADYFGVYNFIFSGKGRGNYKNEIIDGHFFFIENFKEFYKKVAKLNLEKKEARAKLYAKVDIDNLFKNLLLKKRNIDEK